MDSIDYYAEPNICRVICGNKIDMEDKRKVSTHEGSELAKKIKVQYFESPAKLG